MDPQLLLEAERRLATLPPSVQQKVGRLIAEARRIGTREQAQRSFLAYVRHVWPGFIHGRHHEIMAEAFEKVVKGTLKRLIINMPPRHAILTSTLIPTMTGLKPLLDLQTGDCVFGPDGKPVRVIGKSDVFRNRGLYRVWTDDEAYLDVDGEHLWTVRLDRKHNIYNDYTTEQLWRRQNGEVLRTKRSGEIEFMHGKHTDPRKVRLPRLPDVAPVQYPEAQLPIDPYVLGVWLGDGAALQATVSMCNADAAIVRAEIERRMYVTKDRSTRFSFGVSNLKTRLRDLGVLGNKHIPPAYLTASVQQRRDLLKGLMDTDGTVSKEGQCFFSQSNKAFILQVLELIRSLGIKANLLNGEARIKEKSYGITWEISFYANDVFLLPRKEARTLKTQRCFGRYIKIEKLDYAGDVQCIKVDRSDGLFLAGEGYVCTHNTKSEFASYLLPSWFLGLHPGKKVIQTSHTAELAVGFGRKVRNLVDSEKYKEIFPDVELQADSKAAGRWNTNAMGEYFAIGVGGAVTGKGADLLIIDDAHSEQEATIAETNPEVYDKTYEWYTSGPRQRLQPGGAIVTVQTRWSKKDLVGQILTASAQRDGEEWEVIEFPAILETAEGERALWPEFWELKELEVLRNELPRAKWMAQYMQQPTSDVSAIVKREWWRIWEQDDPPFCEYIIQSWDTAFLKSERADYSACTTWGVFKINDDKGLPQTHIILLNSFKERLEFPELKRAAMDEYKDWKPDSLIVEAKAAGSPLIYELRAMGIPVQEFVPSKGNDKIARLNAVADIFASGRVWAPARPWAEEVMEEIASFPSGEHDDLVDSSSQALLRFRRGGFLRLETDEPEPPPTLRSLRRREYY